MKAEISSETRGCGTNDTSKKCIIWILLSCSTETMKPMEASECLKRNHPLKYVFVFYVVQESAAINSLRINVLAHLLC